MSDNGMRTSTGNVSSHTFNLKKKRFFFKLNTLKTINDKLDFLRCHPFIRVNF